MADVTYEQLQERIARKLQIIASAESLDANDAAVIIDGLLSVQAQLDRLGIATFDVQSGIDHPYVEVIAQMGAAELVDDFQIPEPRRSQLFAAGKIGLPNRSLAERALRDLIDGTTAKLSVSTDVTVV